MLLQTYLGETRAVQNKESSEAMDSNDDIKDVFANDGFGFNLHNTAMIGGYYRSTSIYEVLLLYNALLLHDSLCYYGSKCILCKMFNLSKCYTKFVSMLMSEEDEDPF